MKNSLDHTPNELKNKAPWFLTFGIILIILGTLAIIFSFTSTIFSVVYLGILFIILGLFEGIQSFKLKPIGNFLLHFLIGILYIAGGVFLIAYPIENAITLTLLLAIFFVITGIMRIVITLTRPLPHPGWFGVSGLLNIALGVLIWQQWPLSGLWVLGTFVGIDAIVTGWTWVRVSRTLKNNTNIPRA